MSRLAVWMYGTQVGVLSRRRDALGFSYTQGALDDGLGRPLLSVAMPTRPAAYRGAVPAAFFDGLLPEGEARRMIAFDFGVDERDVMGLLTAIGRDCAGALVIIPDGDALDEGGVAEPIGDGQVAQRLRALRFAPLGVDQRVRVSLAGVQEKLLLARAGGGWGLPIDGAPSTHIVKPAHQFLADSIANEAFCMRLARHLDIPAASVETREFEGIPVLVVERYDRDRAPAGDGRVTRLHQEDFCQARALPTQRKYEQHGGASLRQCAETLSRWSRRADQLSQLLDYVTLNVLVGNADAHAKNLSLLHEPGGEVRLAPAYDVMSTVQYPNVSTIPGMFVNAVRDINDVRREDLIAEAVSWGMAPGPAAEQIERVVRGAGEAIGPAAAETRPPDDLVERVQARRQTLGA